MNFGKIPKPVRYLIYDECDHFSLVKLRQTCRLLRGCLMVYLRKNFEKSRESSVVNLLSKEKIAARYKENKFLFSADTLDLVCLGIVNKIKKFYERMPLLSDSRKAYALYISLMFDNEEFFDMFENSVSDPCERLLCLAIHFKNEEVRKKIKKHTTTLYKYILIAVKERFYNVLDFFLGMHKSGMQQALVFACKEKNVDDLKTLVEFLRIHNDAATVMCVEMTYCYFVRENSESEIKFLEENIELNWNQMPASALKLGSAKVLKKLIDDGKIPRRFPELNRGG